MQRMRAGVTAAVPLTEPGDAPATGDVNLTDAGAIALADALRTNSSLTRLSIKGTTVRVRRSVRQARVHTRRDAAHAAVVASVMCLC
jgi:hypothetical protein